MKEEKMKTYERYVEKALRERPETRGDDNLLYIDVLRQIDPALVNVNFLITFKYARQNKLPAYETLSRISRNLRGKHPELQPSEEIKKAKEEHQMDMFAYAMEERWNVNNV